MTPLCKCHGEPQTWHGDVAHSGGGAWRCPIRIRERQRARYHADPSKHQARMDRYHATPGGRRARMRSRLNESTRRIQAAINQLED